MEKVADDPLVAGDGFGAQVYDVLFVGEDFVKEIRDGFCRGSGRVLLLYFGFVYVDLLRQVPCCPFALTDPNLLPTVQNIPGTGVPNKSAERVRLTTLRLRQLKFSFLK